MSILIEKIKDCAKGDYQPIGFAASANREKGSGLVVITRFNSWNALKEFHTTDTDAAIIPMENLSQGIDSLSTISKVLNDIPWGVEIRGGSTIEIKELIKYGCDFTIFSLDSSLSSLHIETDIGKILLVDPLISDSYTKMISFLPIDIIMIREDKGVQLSIESILNYRRIVYLSGKPVVLMTGKLNDDDIEAIYDADIRGLVIEWENDASNKKLCDIRTSIQSLPKKKRNKKSGSDAKIPRIETGIFDVIEEIEEPEDCRS